MKLYAFFDCEQNFFAIGRYGPFFCQRRDQLAVRLHFDQRVKYLQQQDIG